jgi:hypothetical protein
MHSITVVFGPASLRFLFRSKERTEQFRAFRTDHPTQDLIIDDDFGQHAEIKALSIHGIVIEDLDQSKMSAVEMMLHDARTRATAQSRAQSDTQLRSAGRGPSVLTPMGGMNGG